MNEVVNLIAYIAKQVVKFICENWKGIVLMLGVLALVIVIYNKRLQSKDNIISSLEVDLQKERSEVLVISNQIRIQTNFIQSSERIILMTNTNTFDIDILEVIESIKNDYYKE